VRGVRPLLVLLFLGGLLAARARPALFLPPPVISAYGDWIGGTGGFRAWQHYGIDIRVPAGTPVLAAADGAVLRVAEGPISGKMIILSHADDLATSYYHLSFVGVAEGQRVQRGETIGQSGRSGNASTPHLHFGVCRARGGRCGNRIQHGWDDPTRHWVDGNPCFQNGELFRPDRLTYPVPCQLR
jgi:murein DD-endopeptidase MepM/ murein hydrolase activator NlpD